MATRHRFLARAPITEAVIDFQVAAPSGKFTDLEAAFSNVNFGYKVSGYVAAGNLGFAIDANADQIATSMIGMERVGLRLDSPDGKYVAQFRTTGFSLSRLAPYETWEKLHAEARRIWDIYARTWVPTSIKRVATRYINNLNLPMTSGEDFGAYIDTLVEIPKALPQYLGGFLQRFRLSDPASDVAAIITLVWDSPPLPGDANVPVILDIDAFAERKFELRDEAVWSCLRQLHDMKNRCFFGILTDKAAELYE